jgi:hypothetical protein
LKAKHEKEMETLVKDVQSVSTWHIHSFYQTDEYLPWKLFVDQKSVKWQGNSGRLML